MRRHIKNDHQPKEKCGRAGCNVSTYTQELLRKHQKTDHKDWICKAYNCGDEIFSTEELLMEHIKNDHQQPKINSIKCGKIDCEFSTYSQEMLRRHRKYAHGIEVISNIESGSSKKISIVVKSADLLGSFQNFVTDQKDVTDITNAKFVTDPLDISDEHLKKEENVETKN